jgi:hypothetical protein
LKDFKPFSPPIFDANWYDQAQFPEMDSTALGKVSFIWVEGGAGLAPLGKISRLISKSDEYQYTNQSDIRTCTPPIHPYVFPSKAFLNDWCKICSP